MISGGWDFVAAAYGVTYVVLALYSISVVRRAARTHSSLGFRPRTERPAAHKEQF